MAATSFSTELAYPPELVTISAVSENECGLSGYKHFALAMEMNSPSVSGSLGLLLYGKVVT